MKFDQLKTRLSKYANVAVAKEGLVLTILLIADNGDNLSNWDNVKNIQSLIVSYAGNKYPIIEALRNDTTYFLIVLKPKNE